MGAGGLSFRVRDGSGRDSSAMTTETWSGACLRGVCWVGGLVVDRIVDALVCLAQKSVRIILCVIGRVSTGRLGARYWVSTSGLSTQSSSGGLPTPPLYSL